MTRNPTIRFPPVSTTDDTVLRRAVHSGLLAGAVSAGVAGWRSAAEGSTALAPINAVTHCLWPRRALRERRFSARFTLTGLAIHSASAVFWALLFEALNVRLSRYAPRADPVAVAAAATATAATAYIVDYHIVPERVTPGFDVHLSSRSLTAVYVALAVGLASAALLRAARVEQRD
jgi:hypothetical protein